ncbi:hypothetical protein ACOAJ8_00070 [Arcobacter cryaerophilus gv. pseudocryaerophilus]
MREQNIFTQTGANSTQIQNQINNPIFIVPESTNIRKVFFKNREIIKISAILFPLLLSVSFAISFGFEEIFLYFGLPYNKFIFFIFYVLSFAIYFYFLIRFRWFLDKGFLKYENAKMIFNYNNEFEEINYSDIHKVEKEKSFITGTTFFIYKKEDKKAKIKFNFYNYKDVKIFEDKLINKNIIVDNLE